MHVETGADKTAINFSRTKMALLTIACSFILLITTTINHPSAAARSLSNSNPSDPHSHLHKLTFLMRDVLMNVTQPSSKTKPATTKVISPQLPFSKPLGVFPTNGGVPISEINPMHPSTTSPISGFSTQTLDLSSIGLFFPARTTLQELEFGEVTVIDEDIFETFTSGYGSLVIGKAQGMYVASSEDGSSHMMAVTAHFANSKDGLRLFGVHHRNVHDKSHIAVIGGIGKYVGANGYATVKTVKTEEAASKMLKLNVYLI